MTPEHAHAVATEEFAPQVAARAVAIREEYFAGIRDTIAAKRAEVDAMQAELDAETAAAEPQG